MRCGVMQPPHHEQPSSSTVSIFIGPIATLDGRSAFVDFAHAPRWVRFAAMAVQHGRVIALAQSLADLDP